jgi:hypothetical protein
MLEVGKFYQTGQYWLMFSSPEYTLGSLAVAYSPGEVDAGSLGMLLALAGDRSGAPVHCTMPDGMFVVLEVEDVGPRSDCHYKILTSEGVVGWIFYPYWRAGEIEEALR